VPETVALLGAGLRGLGRESSPDMAPVADAA